MNIGLLNRDVSMRWNTSGKKYMNGYDKRESEVAKRAQRRKSGALRPQSAPKGPSGIQGVLHFSEAYDHPFSWIVSVAIRIQQPYVF
jgi:hypothetical protein